VISPRAVALQGLGYGALLTAVQGLASVAVIHQPAVVGMSRRIEVRSRRRNDDDEILLILMAALHVLDNS
jgi:hypothetical protein